MHSTSGPERSRGKVTPNGPTEPRPEELLEQEATHRVPVTNQVPDEVEWEESLIGIEPNSGVVDPPPIC